MTVAEALNLAWQHQRAGRLALAEQGYRQILQSDPHHLDALFGLGTVYLRMGQADQALAPLQVFVRLRPDHADAVHNLAVAYASCGRLPQAVACFREALRLRPDDATTANDLAFALFNLGRHAEAAERWRTLLRRTPEDGDLQNSLAVALAALDQLDDAVTHFQEALRLKPEFAEAHSNIALALVGLGRFMEAEEHARQALRLRPDYAEAHNQLGLALLKQGRRDEALFRLEEALRLAPRHAEAHKNRAIVWLQQGDYARGWSEFEWRWHCRDFTPRRFVQPRWDGLPLAGRTILLHAEQGLGDTIQFIRYAPLVHARGGRVLFECPAALHPLLRGFPGIDGLLAKGGPLPAFDVEAPLLSLPALFGTTLDTVPAAVPYLTADTGLVERWRQELRSVPGFKVGIAWAGSPKYRADRQRSIPLRHFAALAHVEGVRLLSLQKANGTEQLREVADAFPILDLGARLDEQAGAFMDTAAVMTGLDLVITADTSLLHLAGALGVPVWAALAQVPDWRWPVGRDDSPWYPTLRLFRQRATGDWDDVFARLARELRIQIG